MGTPVAMTAGGARPLLGPGGTPVGKVAHTHTHRQEEEEESCIYVELCK